MKIHNKYLLWCGLLAGPLFMTSLLIHGALKPDYNWLRHPGSSLALGPYGWVQTLTFLITGVLSMAFAIGLWRIIRKGTPKGTTWGPLLVGYWAIMLIVDGICTTDPASGYPKGTPNIPLTHTLHGSIHDSFALPAFVGMIIACCFIFSRWFKRQEHRKWAVYSVINGVMLTTSFALSALAFNQAPKFVAYGGLYQRIAAFCVWSYLTALAIHVLRTTRRDT